MITLHCTRTETSACRWSAADDQPTMSAISLIDPLATPEWDARVAEFPDATIFHGAAWARTLHHAYGFRPEYHVLRGAAGDAAILPVMEVNSWLTGRRGVGLPFTDACAPLSRGGPDDIRLVLASAIRRGAERGWRHLEVRGQPDEAERPEGQRAVHVGHRLALSENTTELWNGLDPATRRAVRRARELGVEVTSSTALSDLAEFYALMGVTRRRHGLPPQPWTFFVRVHDHLISTGHGHVWLARHEGKPVAGAVFLNFCDQVIYKWGASLERWQQLRANNLVMWEAIAWHAQHGHVALDLGRTASTNEGLRRFKRGWGAVEYPLSYLRIDLRTGERVATPDGAAGWHTALFRHAPPTLSRWVGNLLYRHAA